MGLCFFRGCGDVLFSFVVFKQNVAFTCSTMINVRFTNYLAIDF